MSLPAEMHRYTILDYLQIEEKSEIRHEFHDGEILAMSGGTYRHSRINMNFGAALQVRLKGKPCHPLDSNMRVRIPRQQRYFYPDISVVCGRPEFDSDDPKQTTIVNPRLVIEVLSESTESYDRGAKFDWYREIPSLEEYVLVSQREPRVESFLRHADGAWLFRAWKGVPAVAMLQSLELTLPLAEIYDGIEFESVPPPPAI